MKGKGFEGLEKGKGRGFEGLDWGRGFYETAGSPPVSKGLDGRGSGKGKDPSSFESFDHKSFDHKSFDHKGKDPSSSSKDHPPGKGELGGEFPPGKGD